MINDLSKLYWIGVAVSTQCGCIYCVRFHYVYYHWKDKVRSSSVHCTVYNVNCINKWCKVPLTNDVHCTINYWFKGYNAHCTSIVDYTSYTVHCTLYILC